MQCRERERGSALLIVFLFAAFVAIMLYKEMPVMAFEAQRAKEQLLIDRGNQYKQAVKVYWTHFQGRFPPSIDALENTNNIRFLRHRYKDPLTGKDNWRLLHMAPGGMGLIDSKVNPMPTAGQNGTNTQNGNTQSSFGGIAGGTSAFGNQPAANNNSTPASGGTNIGEAQNGGLPNSVGGPPVYAVPQRPPAIAANGAPGANGVDPNYDPNDPKNFINADGTPKTGMNAFLNPQQNPNGPPMAAPGQSVQSPTQSSPNQAPNAVQQIYGMIATQGAPPTQNGISGPIGQASFTTNTGTSAPGSNATGTSSFGSNNGTNTTLGGMFAGVASVAQGRGIKVVNDQHEYQKWEFWFNPQDPANGVGNGIAGAAPINQTANGGVNPNSSSNNASSSNSAFGNSGSGLTNFGSTFGNSNSTTTPAQPVNPQPQQ